MDDPKPAADPLEGAEMLAHWGFVFDLDDSEGGGFVSGEVLLRSDGVLLRRYGTSYYRDGQTTWKYGPWASMPRWSGGAEPDEAMRWLKAGGYGLCRPTLPVDRQEAGPFPGMPEPTEYL
jgi:hypothetical protein